MTSAGAARSLVGIGGIQSIQDGSGHGIDGLIGIDGREQPTLPVEVDERFRLGVEQPKAPLDRLGVGVVLPAGLCPSGQALAGHVIGKSQVNDASGAGTSPLLACAVVRGKPSRT